MRAIVVGPLTLTLSPGERGRTEKPLLRRREGIHKEECQHRPFYNGERGFTLGMPTPPLLPLGEGRDEGIKP